MSPSSELEVLNRKAEKLAQDAERIKERLMKTYAARREVLKCIAIIKHNSFKSRKDERDAARMEVVRLLLKERLPVEEIQERTGFKRSIVLDIIRSKTPWNSGDKDADRLRELLNQDGMGPVKAIDVYLNS